MAGRYHLLVGLGDLVVVLLVEKFERRERIHGFGQFARNVDPHRPSASPMATLCGHAVSFSVNCEIGQAERTVRCALRIGRGEQRRHRVIAEVEARPLDRRVDHGEVLDALLAQRRRSCDSAAMWRRQNGQCRPRNSPTSTGFWPRKSSMAILPSRVIASSTTLGAISPGCKGPISMRVRHVEPPPGQSRNGSTTSASGSSPCWAHISCARLKVTIGLGQIVEVEIERCQAIIAWKQQLRLASFARDLERLAVEAAWQFGLAVALMDLAEHDQRHRQVLALVERPVDLDRLFGRRHAFVWAAVGEGAAGDGEVGQQPRLEAEVADAARDLEAAPAHVDRPRRIDRRVEHAEIGVAAAGRARAGRRPRPPRRSCSTSRTASRLRPMPRQRDALGVERLGGGKRGLAPASASASAAERRGATPAPRPPI